MWNIAHASSECSTWNIGFPPESANLLYREPNLI